MPNEVGRPRWRLNRAGIVNVYQYEHEVIDLSGGRLLLRGVNGSGKSTAMNMLLPFLVTARQTRIDAAGEQTGVLKSWMLNDRDDAQPIGYLWIEFVRGDQFLTCGCGIKANRSSDTVTTWWFITDRRPEVDFHLVERRVPLSADALRATLAGPGDEVFNDRSRRDYRSSVERRLFGGSSIDQHIDLLNIVRNPRVGDRIDQDLPEHIVASLPRPSEQALQEAAQPLDDLEAHRANVEVLARTRDAIGGLLEVYRPYVVTQLADYVGRGRQQLRALATATKEHDERLKVQAEAATRLADAEAESLQVASELQRLNAELTGLRESDYYRKAEEIQKLRDDALAAQALATDTEHDLERAIGARTRVATERERLEATAADDESALRAEVAAVLTEADRLGVDHQPIPPIEPTNLAALDAGLRTITGGFRRRRGDLEHVEAQRGHVDRGERDLATAREAEITARRNHDLAVARVESKQREAADERAQWRLRLSNWYLQLSDRYPEGPITPPDTAQTADTPQPAGTPLSADTPQPADTEADLHDSAATWLADQLASAHKTQAVATNIFDQATEALSLAQARMDELAARSEPEMPHLAWQRAEPVRLADLIDFQPGVSADDQAGIEAAMEASGLLSARLADKGVVELGSGELVVVGPPDPTASTPAEPLSVYLRASIPSHATDVDAAMVNAILGSISTSAPSASSTAATTTNTVVGPDGHFVVGSLSGRHHKPAAEFVGRSARQAALERARAEAAEHLSACQDHHQQCLDELTAAKTVVEVLGQAGRDLPSLAEVDRARAEVEVALEAEQVAAHDLASAVEAAAEADAALASLWDELQRQAASFRLPPDRGDLDRFAADLSELERNHRQLPPRLERLDRSVKALADAIDRFSQAEAEAGRLESKLRQRQGEAAERQMLVATVEDAIGVEVAEVLAAISTSEAELKANRQRQHELATAHTELVRADQAAQDAVTQQAATVAGCNEACDTLRSELAEVVAIDGLLETVEVDPDAEAQPVITTLGGHEGLDDLVGQLDARLPSERPPVTNADSVRGSLRQRRDALGAGWDAEESQPDLSRPMVVIVNGPSGKGTLADQFRVVRSRHREITGLLTRKQDDALRGLLQGHLASEIATKVDEANRLIELMNVRLSQVRTAHDVGVELRWNRAADLDPDTDRLVELLSTVPDLRRAEDDQELRKLLAARLDQVRADNPDVPYRQLIGDTLDYRQWHELSVLLHRGSHRPKRLRRSTPLSEGEKKLVTYLPMFAAVAASYDALDAEATEDGGVARFMLLDDAFAKVSEDNHPKLFGLIVDLDLDVVATSERLWGTHSTVPELAITEVIRDANAGVILLEHYRWDGKILERRGDA